MELEHKGIAIQVNTLGEFEAQAGGVDLKAASIKSMRQRIDTLLADGFKAFEGYLHQEHWRSGDTFEKVEVAGLCINGSRRGRTAFKLVGRRPEAQVILDSAENRAAMKSYLAHSKEMARITRELQEKKDTLYAAIQVLKAEDHGKSA